MEKIYEKRVIKILTYQVAINKHVMCQRQTQQGCKKHIAIHVLETDPKEAVKSIL